MSGSKSTNTYNRQNWEESDFPILCQVCLGENPYIRMTKLRYGDECKICCRPFTVFRWCPGARMRFKKTEICQTCAKVKNVCQTCLLDLEYGLPVQVRDEALKTGEELAKSDVNKEYQLQNIERQIQQDPNNPPGKLGKAQPASDILSKLARTTPYYRRNLPHICSFWVKGECRRGEECPFRHEKPSDPDDPLSEQNIRDRYYGVNDPVADKLMNRYQSMPKLTPPPDKAVTTLYVGGVTPEVTESALRDHFYQFGEIRSISIVPKQMCAFVQYTTRTAAEKAAEQSFNKLTVAGRRLVVKWGKSQPSALSIAAAAAAQPPPPPPLPGIPAVLPEPAMMGNFFNLQQYPSQDPTRLGAPDKLN